MKKLALALVIGSFMVLTQTQNAKATTINFDDVASGTNINTQYTGVTLGCFNGTVSGDNMCTGNAYAVASPSAHSSPNVISLTSSVSGAVIDERYGYFKASFASLVSSVSIDALPLVASEFSGDSNHMPFLQAYDTNGHLLGTVNYSAVNTNTLCASCAGAPWQTLAFTDGTADIKFIAFSSYNGGTGGVPVYGEFDNLTYCGANEAGCAGGGGNNNGGGTSVPEPSSLLLLGFGVVGLALLGRNRFKTIQAN